jgi:uncharacterized alkaline shock family protein YloU
MAETYSKPIAERGTTTIADVVVAKTAGITARQVYGVHALGSGAAQRIGAVRQRIGAGGPGFTSGVSVDVGEKEAAVDLVIEVNYGEPVHRVADNVRNDVISAVEGITGLQVVEVNITVDDVYVEGDEESERSSGEKGR